MKIRITGLPDEVDQAVKAICGTGNLDVIEISQLYPYRGKSRMTRRYITARVSGQQRERPS